MESYIIQTKLLEQGILTENGEVNKDKINLLSGAFARPLVDMLQLYDEDGSLLRRLIALLFRLQGQGETAALAIHILCDLGGLIFPEDIQNLCQHPKARDYFLFSLLLDLEEIAAEQWAE